MCTVCGCGEGETRIEGDGHEHVHRHADGTVHSHAHDHLGDHGHDHSGMHRHADGTVHSHAHDGADPSHAHGEVQGQSSGAAYRTARVGHGHSHFHRHADGSWHSNAHDHPGEQVRAQSDSHSHAHDPVRERVEEHGAPRAEGEALNYGAGPAGAHAPGLTQARMVRIEQDILSKNNGYAAANRRLLAERGIFAVNLVSSPGSGKTTLLVRTIETLKGRRPLAVIEGDQQTSVDAERIRATGAPAIQVNTGKGCHLDAHMVGNAVGRLGLQDGSLLLIENVGNLVCPADFDLGEAHKVVILSVTEGEDKPLKYPNMFRAADLMLLNKVDLLPHLDFDAEKCVAHARQVNPKIAVMRVSARTGEGMDDWLAWLERGVAGAAAARAQTVDALRRRVAELEAQLAARSA